MFLPSCLRKLVGNKERDSIRVTYQVQTSFSEEAEHEGVKYTCYVLLTVLRDKLHESETVHHVRVYAEYFSHFAADPKTIITARLIAPRWAMEASTGTGAIDKHGNLVEQPAAKAMREAEHHDAGKGDSHD